MKKAILLLLVSLCLLYFCIGLFLALFNIVDFQTYGMGATVAGGLASILGLLGFLLPKLTTDDIKNIELVAIKNLVKVSEEITNKTEELNRRKNELSQKDRDIQELELQKQEMEFLIKKAGLLHYLKEQFFFKEKSIVDFLDSNEGVKTLIDETIELKKKIQELDKEIDQSKYADFLQEIIVSADIGQRNQRKPLFLIILKAYRDILFNSFELPFAIVKEGTKKGK